MHETLATATFAKLLLWLTFREGCMHETLATTTVLVNMLLWLTFGEERVAQAAQKHMFGLFLY